MQLRGDLKNFEKFACENKEGHSYQEVKGRWTSGAYFSRSTAGLDLGGDI